MLLPVKINMFPSLAFLHNKISKNEMLHKNFVRILPRRCLFGAPCKLLEIAVRTKIIMCKQIFSASIHFLLLKMRAKRIRIAMLLCSRYQIATNLK